jgi:hypothetical protein
MLEFRDSFTINGTAVVLKPTVPALAACQFRTSPREKRLASKWPVPPNVFQRMTPWFHYALVGRFVHDQFNNGC